MKNPRLFLLLLITVIAFSCNNQKKERNEETIENQSLTKSEQITAHEPIKKKPAIIHSSPIVSSKKQIAAKPIQNTPEPKKEEIVVKDSIKQKTPIFTRVVNVSSKKDTALEIFYKENEKKPQQFLANTAKDTTIVCAENTKITIHGNSFVSSKTGKEITGKVQISVKEYYKMSDILLAKLSTTSDGKLLESGGMINITAKSGDEECELKVGKTIEIEFPTKKGKAGMQLFSGVRNDENEINWVLDEEAIQYNQDFSNSVDELPVYPGGINEMNKFIANNFVAPEEEISGTIYVNFIIDKTGNVTDVKINKGLSKEIDKEAIRVVNMLSTFIPGKLKGIAVNTFYNLPIRIGIEGVEKPGDYIYQTKGGKKAKFEKDFNKDELLKDAGAESINSYLLSSTQLGMINCDRFLDEENKINYTINFNNDSETSVNIVFHRIKAFMSQFTNSVKVSFNNIPSGEKITIIAIKYVQDKPYLAITDTDTSSKLENGLVFQAVTVESLKSEMKKLDRFN